MSAVWLVIASLGWTALLAFGAELVTSRQSSPHFARSIWRSAAFLMVLPWIVAGISFVWPGTMDVPLPDVEAIPGVAGSALSAVSEAQLNVRHASGPEIGQWILLVLIAGWIWRLGRALHAQLRLQHLKHNSTVCSTSSERIAVTIWAHRLGLAAPPRIARMNRQASPYIAGMKHRTIYLPRTLDCQQTSALVLAHECVHLARHDLVTRPLERLVADILWFSPFAWLARIRLDYLREAVCDAETVELTGNRAAYARALTNVARSVRRVETLPVSAFILRRKSSLSRRVTGILATGKPRTSALTSVLAVVTALAAMPLAIAQGVQFERVTLKPDFRSAIVGHSKARITSPYGKRTDPWGNEHIHRGIDIAAPKGVLIKTPADGIVVHAGYKEGYGWNLKVRFNDGTKMRFANLGSFVASEGDEIKAGDVIGIMGVSGRSNGPHVHVEYWRPDASDGQNWQAHDPVTIEGLELVCSNENAGHS